MVLACATTLESDTPPTCRPLEESSCDFSLELPLREAGAMVGLFFVQDDDGSGEADGAERVAKLIDEKQGAPLCNGDVVRVEDVAVDFAEAAPSAAAIHKLVDACGDS
jgi:hypothetical protein